jgi:hypothetical protein
MSETTRWELEKLVQKKMTLIRMFKRAMAADDLDVAQVFSDSLDELDDQIARRRETEWHFEVATREGAK